MTAKRERNLSAPLDLEPPKAQAAARGSEQQHHGVLAGELVHQVQSIGCHCSVWRSALWLLLTGEKLQFWRQMGELNPAAFGNVGRHGKEQLMGQRKLGPEVGSNVLRGQVQPIPYCPCQVLP